MAFIDREAFIEDIDTEIINLYFDGLKGTPRPREELYGFIDRIKEQPTVDAVEVVRCKDCQLRDTEGCPMMCWDVSGDLMGETKDNDFCSYGERKKQ